MRYKNFGTSFFHFVPIHAFDRQTDRQTDGQKGLGNTVRCITCSRTVKRNRLVATFTLA